MAAKVGQVVIRLIRLIIAWTSAQLAPSRPGVLLYALSGRSKEQYEPIVLELLHLLLTSTE